MYHWSERAIERLLTEHDNLRAALRWFRQSSAVEPAARLGGQLWGIWVNGGYLTEGQAQLRELLALPGVSHASAAWARLAYSYGLVELFLGNYAVARASLEQAAGVQRALADPLLATTLGSIGQTAREQGDYAAARVWLLDSLAVARALDLRPVVAHALLRLGTVAHAQGDGARAQRELEESLALSRQLEDALGSAWSLYHLGCLALDQREYAIARAWLSQGLTAFPAFDKLGLTYTLAAFATLAAAEGQPLTALRLSGATAALTERTGISIHDIDGLRYTRWLEIARHAVPDAAAATALAQGRQLRLDQAIACALAPPEPVAAAGRPAGQLTPRQLEVATLIGRGLTNRQIAQQLVVTERTAAAHVEQILDRLGVGSRAQIAVWASEQGLLATHPG